MNVNISGITSYFIKKTSISSGSVLPFEISPQDIIDRSADANTYVIMYIKVSDFINVIDSIYPSFNTNLRNLLLSVSDEYITVHLNNVHVEAVKSVISYDVNRLYNLKTYNENITTYHDDYVINNLNNISCNPNTIGETLSLSYYGDVLLRMAIYDMSNYFLSYNNNTTSRQEKKIFTSHLSFFLESILKCYGIYSVLDYTRETESFFLSRFFIPAQENVFFHSCLGDINDYLISLGSDPNAYPFGYNLYLFFRIARHFDGDPITNKPRTITSYLFDNKNVSLMESIIGSNSYILEMYYDSYYGIIRDYKDYPMMLFLPDGNPNATISLSSLPSSVSKYFYNEGHIFKTSTNDNITREGDDFFVTSRISSSTYNGGLVGFNTWVSYSSSYDSFVGYAPLDTRIKRWILFYHDWTAGTIKDKKKYCFMFLMKMYNIKYEDNKVSFYHFTNSSQIQSQQYFTNTDIIKEVEPLSNIIRFIALHKMGFKILTYASNVTVEENIMPNVRLKTLIPINEKTESTLDFFDLYYLNNYKTKDRSMFYYASYQLYPTFNTDCMFHAYNQREDIAVNDVEFIYNMYYNNGKSYIMYFNHNMSMRDFGDIISCGNLLYFYTNQMFIIIPESHFIKDCLLKGNLTDLQTLDGYTGGIILFNNPSSGFDLYPFIRFIDSDSYVEKYTGETSPIFFTSYPQELDRRLYAYNLPFVLNYNPNIFDVLTFGGTIRMRTYTDRHKSITQKDKRLKNLQVRNGMYINYNKAGIDRYKTASKDINNNDIYYYYKYDSSSGNYIAITDINEIIDKKLVHFQTIQDSYFSNITSTIDQVFFMENIFNYVINNINNIKIPIIDQTLIYEEDLNYNNFNMITSGNIYRYKSIYEDVMDPNINIYGTTPVNAVSEYDEESMKYYREFLYNKYLRSIIIFINSQIYRIITDFESNASEISLSGPDFTVTGVIEVKKIKDLDSNQIPYVINFNPNLNMNSQVKVANVDIQIKTIQSGIIEETIIYIIVP